MKITHVIPFYAPAWGFGGPVRVCYDLANEFASRGHQVCVLTTDAYDHIKRIDQVCEELNKVKVFRARNLSAKLAKGYNLFIPRKFGSLCKQNIKNADMVHLHSFYTILNVVASKYARKYKVPYIVHFHESIRPTPERGKALIKKIFIHFWGKKMLSEAKSIVVLSSGELEELKLFDAKLAEKAVIIPNPGPKYKGANKQKEQIRQKLGFKKDDKILLSLSRLSYLKGIDSLISVFRKTVDLDPKFNLIIAGPSEPGIRESLEAQTKALGLTGSVTFKGMVSEKEKDELYSVADLYCLFSRYEPFGVTILEALSHGIPAVLNKGVGIAKELEQTGCSSTVDASKPSIASKIVIGSFKNKSKMHSACQEALNKYQIAKIYSSILNSYKDALNDK